MSHTLSINIKNVFILIQIRFKIDQCTHYNEHSYIKGAFNKKGNLKKKNQGIRMNKYLITC